MYELLHRCQRRSRQFAGIFVLLGLLAALWPARPALAQSGTCKSSNNGHLVTVCLSEPADGATLSGPVEVKATAGGWGWGVVEVVFSLDGQYLLTDTEAPYGFVLPTTHFANGEHTLSARAVMRDGSASAAPALKLTFANAGTPTPAPEFTPVAPDGPADGQSLVVAATGDGAGGEINADRVSQMLDGWNPDLFLYLGDVYEAGTYTEFYNWYGTSTTYFGRLRDVTNPTIGNHEYKNGAAPGYFAYWNNPPEYYSYDAGGWHFIALNSSGGASQTDARSAQYEWLADDLGKKSACSIAYFHHPVLSAGAQGDAARMKAMWSLLAKKGVDIVLTGHDHSYQRWVRLDANLQPSGQGTVQFVAGAGGHGVQGAAREDERLAVMHGDPTKTYGALHLKLNPKGAEYRYVNTDGQILDQGVVPCSGTTDASAPGAPGALTATTADSGQVKLAWTAARDETGISSYAIYRNGEQIATVGGAHTEYVDANVDLNATYSYRVDAVDPGGRRSAKSEAAAISRPAQATLVFTPAADTYVHADNPSTNYGRAASLLTDGSPDAQSLLRFALRGIKGSVTRATLRVFAGTGSITGYEVHPVATPTWAEGTVTYDTRPEAGGEVAKSGAFGSGGVWTEVDVTALVTGNGQLDLALRSTGTTAISMSSRESANPPQLVVDVDAGGGPAATALPTPTASPAATGLPEVKPSVGPLPRPSRTPTPADQ